MKPIRDIEIKAKVDVRQWALIRKLKDDSGCVDMQDLILTAMNALRWTLDNTEETSVVVEDDRESAAKSEE